METDSPINLLKMLENESLGAQIDPVESQPVDVWQGFVFEVDGTNFAIPFLGDFEIAPFQELAPLPMVHSWARGVTNIRGEIYTVVDFSEFIGGKPTRTVKGCNLLLLPDERVKSALLIGGRVSLSTFNSDLAETDATEKFAVLPNYLERVITENGQIWHVLDIPKLTSSPAYLQIGRN